MPIGAPPQVKNAILAITDPGSNSGFPANGPDAANKWADVADALLQAVIPPSTTAAAGKAAFIGVLSAVDSNAPVGAALLEAAFLAYAAALGGGMAPLYTGAPPPAPIGLAGLFASTSDDADMVATSMAGMLVGWAHTGIATMILPPFTVMTWV